MEVIIDEKINYVEELKKVLKGGHILAVYRECDSLFAERVIKTVENAYRITKKVLASSTENTRDVVEDIREADDDIRLILAFGGHNVIECCKQVATLNGIALVVILTTPTRINEQESVIFDNNSLCICKTVEPSSLLVSRNHIAMRSDFSDIVSLFAEQMLVAYDRLFQNLVQGLGLTNLDKIGNIIAKAKRLDENKKIEMLEQGYEIENSPISTYSKISEIMNRRTAEGVDRSNLKFAITYSILLLYRSYIVANFDDLIYPPDIVASARFVSNLYGGNLHEIIMNYKMMSSREYMRMIHVSREYRSELLAILNKIIDEMQHLSKVMRRVSKDVGYEMYSGIHLDDILEGISALSILEENNTLLRLMKSSGMLERYLVNKAIA